MELLLMLLGVLEIPNSEELMQSIEAPIQAGFDQKSRLWAYVMRNAGNLTPGEV